MTSENTSCSLIFSNSTHLPSICLHFKSSSNSVLHLHLTKTLATPHYEANLMKKIHSRQKKEQEMQEELKQFNMTRDNHTNQENHKSMSQTITQQSLLSVVSFVFLL